MTLVISLVDGGYMIRAGEFICEACQMSKTGISTGALLAQFAPAEPPPANLLVRTVGQRGSYPAATLAYYGPNNELATKLVVSIVKKEGAKLDPLHRWITHAGDIRKDPAITAEVEAFLKQHGVRQRAITDRIIGCPHEEGTDYPLGGVCPQCPFWANRDRFTHELLSATPKSADAPLPLMQPYRAAVRIGRNDPCPCGSGRKYKKCCGK
jgi:hypothetical protein